MVIPRIGKGLMDQSSEGGFTTCFLVIYGSIFAISNH